MDFLNEVEKKLDLPPGEKAEVIRELKSHYEELKGELVASGMDANLAAQEASRKLGDPSDVASRMQTVHCQATHKSALLTVLPLLGLALNAAAISLIDVHSSTRASLLSAILEASTIVVIALVIAGSFRELRAGRRPVWLATWLAVGVTMLISTIRLFVYQVFGPMITVEHTDTDYVVSHTTLLLVIAPLALWAWQDSVRYTRVVVGALALAIALIAQTAWIPLPQQIGWGVLYVSVLPSVLLMTIALRLFASHPYGAVCQASLFLLAAYACGPLTPGKLTVAALAGPVARILLAGIVAWAVVRAPTHRRKLPILSLGVFVIAVGGRLAMGLVSHPGVIGFSDVAEWVWSGLFDASFYYVLVVLNPMMIADGPEAQSLRKRLPFQNA